MSEIAICNLALSRIQSAPISSFAEETAEGRACEAVYDLMRDVVLEAHDWGFASRTKELAESTEEHPQYDYMYQYPAGCLVPRSRIDSSGADADAAFEVVTDALGNGRYIASSANPFTLRYTARVEQTGLYPAMFRSALAYRIAAELALKLRSGPEWSIALLELYEKEKARAAAIDAGAGVEADLPDDQENPWKAARN
jgi:hypothetical protein